MAFKSTMHHKMTEFFELNQGTASSECVEWESFKITLRGHCIGAIMVETKALESQITRAENSLLSLE